MGVTENIHDYSGTDLLLGLRWIDMQNYRDPPPYPGHSKQVYTNQPGFRQSYSGSETSTDVSLSSTENLATSQRQEPQGEETQTSFNYHLDLANTESSSYSILERLGMPASAIDSAGKFSGSDIFHVSPSAFHQDKLLQQSQAAASSSSGLPGSSSTLYSKGYLSSPQWSLENNIHMQQNEVVASLGEYTSRSETQALYSSSQSSTAVTAVSKEGPGGNYSSYISPSVRTGPGSDSARVGSGLLPASTCHQYLSPRVPPVSTYHHPHPYVNTHWTSGSGDETSSSHSSLSGYHTSSSLTYSQSGSGNSAGGSTTLYSNHDQSHSYPIYLPPPPQYPGGAKDSSLISGKSADIRTSRSYEAMDKLDPLGSHSDLRLNACSPGIQMHDMKFHSTQKRINNSADDSDHSSISSKACQMVEMLTCENKALREELASTSVKVAKLQKFEMEIQKVHESHEALVRSSQKQESLWVAMKRKLEAKIQSLETQRIDGSRQASGSVTDSECRLMLAEKDVMISRLLSKNQELSSSQNQLEGENAQLNGAIAEQRERIDILENALLNAQTKVMALEEEYRKKQACVDKVDQLQNALKALQTVSDKQGKKEKELRAHLEKELELNRAQEKGEGLKKPELGKEDIKSTGTMRKMLNEKDARILLLEVDLAGMEQKYVKDVTLRGLELEQANHTPNREVRVAALEKNSSDMGKLIDEAKTEKLKHMEELHQSQKSVTELEAQVKQLQTQLVEKEAIVKVFQRSPLAAARSSSLHCLCHSPLHSPHTSLISSHGWIGSSQVLESSSNGIFRDFATIRHVKSGSSSAIELDNRKSMEEDLLSKVQSLSTEGKRESEDEGKLFHV